MVYDMKIALCHLDLSCGPKMQNIQQLEKAVYLAGEQGADWVITPETAVQGYYFYRLNNSAVVPVQPSAELTGLRELCRKYSLTLFLGCGEYDEVTAKNYNSCLVFGADGEIKARHRKLFGECLGAEAWARKGEYFTVVQDEPLKTGVLVCADLWFEENYLGTMQAGAEILVDIAAWPPTQVCGDPLTCWLHASRVTKMSLIVCNQTGCPEWMDMTVGQSVVIDNGELKLAYSGKPAVLLFDYDEKQRKVLSVCYQVISM